MFKLDIFCKLEIDDEKINNYQTTIHFSGINFLPKSPNN